MNPNSAHQWWSRWIVSVDLPYRESHDAPAFVSTLEYTHANFIRSLFGTAGQVRVTRTLGLIGVTPTRERWVLDARVEGHPVHDPEFRSRMTDRLSSFYQSGFGLGAIVAVEASLEAGDWQDGRPSDQLLIIPVLPTTATGAWSGVVNDRRPPDQGMGMPSRPSTARMWGAS